MKENFVIKFKRDYTSLKQLIKKIVALLNSKEENTAWGRRLIALLTGFRVKIPRITTHLEDSRIAGSGKH